VPVNPGSNHISVTAADNAGNFDTDSIIIVRNPDSTPPAVTAVSPVDQVTGVPLDANLSATFNEQMNPATLNAATFVLQDSGANTVPGTVTYSSAGNVASFDPDVNLASASTYTARITTGAMDLAGNNPLAADFVWTFTAGSSIWQTTSTNGAPSYVLPHSVVWTGAEMVVWGATSVGSAGARYNPATDVWQAIQFVGAPSARSSHLAAWTGSVMVIWGGMQQNPLAHVNDGARYIPLTDTWQPMSTVNAPTPRSRATAVWTGTEMIVWGGSDSATFQDLNDGASYNPATDTWQPLTTTGAPSGRSGHTAVWTGSEMIVWGGVASAAWTNTGGRYSPASGTWGPTAISGAPQARNNHAAVWTGSRMVVWGGTAGTAGNPPLNTGGRYDPVANLWQPATTAGAPSRPGVLVQAGQNMMVWGGISSVSDTAVNTGAT
jgi:hypothetical protein